MSVEGTTEERFVQKSLVPYFLEKDIYIQPVSMGGNVNLNTVKKEIEKLAYNFDFVTTMYDFYGFKGLDKNETKQSLENKILRHLKLSIQKKCIPYIQMYEFEALLFTAPNVIGTILGKDKYTNWAQSVLAEFANNPEKINNSFETAPSKRFLMHTSYKKTIDGPNIAHQTGLDSLRAMCAGFDDWLNRLEALE